MRYRGSHRLSQSSFSTLVQRFLSTSITSHSTDSLLFSYKIKHYLLPSSLLFLQFSGEGSTIKNEYQIDAYFRDFFHSSQAVMNIFGLVFASNYLFPARTLNDFMQPELEAKSTTHRCRLQLSGLGIIIDSSPGNISLESSIGRQYP